VLAAIRDGGTWDLVFGVGSLFAGIMGDRKAAVEVEASNIPSVAVLGPPWSHEHFAGSLSIWSEAFVAKVRGGQRRPPGQGAIR
jgi:hypothetical protein